MSEKAYKVVSQEDGQYVSAVERLFRVTYPIGQWAENPEKCGAGLFVFETYMDAERFRNSSTHLSILSIFECEIERMKEQLSKTWLEFPIGTILASRVKLINKIA